MLPALCQPHQVASTMPSTSPIAQPVRQCRVAVIAIRQLVSMPATIYPYGVYAKYRRTMRRALAASALVLATGCSDEPAPTPAPQVPTRSAPTPTASSQSPSATSEPQPVRFEAARAMGTVRHLAGAIGPRLATGPAFERAAAWVATALERQGYDVRRRPVETPAGRSANVVATAPGFDPGSAYVLVGAHLDTVAVAPGAEDNASGVAVLLELARVLGGTGQVVLVAFGAEEPIGPGDLHHFGSKAYVAAMTAAERRHLRAMVSLDRVGVGTVVPLSSVEGTSSA